jgi:hypothetical protein
MYKSFWVAVDKDGKEIQKVFVTKKSLLAWIAEQVNPAEFSPKKYAM